MKNYQTPVCRILPTDDSDLIRTSEVGDPYAIQPDCWNLNDIIDKS